MDLFPVIRVPNEIISIFGHGWLLEFSAVVSFLAISHVLAHAFKAGKDRWDARSYNISGEYIAFYQDERSSQTVDQYSRVHLRQLGTRVKGINTSHDIANSKTRKWQIEGKLYDGNMIIGSYHELARGSHSVGSFFLKKEFVNTDDFRGFWSGWDEENTKISTGTYIFMKRPQTKIFKANNRNMAGIAQISEMCFGQNYFSVGVTPKKTQYKDSAQITVVRDKNNVLIGFCFFYMLPKDGLGAFLNNRITLNNAANDLLNGKAAPQVKEQGSSRCPRFINI
jgi:hypothetical protein